MILSEKSFTPYSSNVNTVSCPELNFNSVPAVFTFIDQLFPRFKNNPSVDVVLTNCVKAGVVVVPAARALEVIDWIDEQEEAE